MKKSVSIIIPTFNGGRIFKDCLEAIKRQKYSGEIQLIIIDSGSTDGTVAEAREAGADIIQIDKEEFNHGRARNRALRNTDYELVIFTVQDAIPVSDNWIHLMVKSLEEDDVVAVTGQQMPHNNADVYARFEVRQHNNHLGSNIKIKSIDSMQEFKAMSYGEALKVVRFDNVCAIYKKDALEEISFPKVAFAEDMAWAKRVLLRGYKVKYDPSIKVRHSHNRIPNYRLRRTIFDIIHTAQILERLRNDLSFIRLQDLYAGLEVIERMYQVIVNDLRMNNGALINSGNRANYFNQLINTVFNKKDKNLDVDWLLNFAKKCELEIKSVLSTISEWFLGVTNKELLLCLEQFTACRKGKLLGEVMVSYQSNGNLPNDIAEVIVPYLRGV
ncbi:MULTISPECIES: glycosyltransferase family 2 protein [unclassified Candidatus Frackibacter]|uniref:glycosyltransferase family 2 protein n=1 Tax=unclassified Candidatus Frackibacter TaxID=2648818 RepID=UPI000891D53A|nr:MULTISPECIES: glycosyltransferase [unclassified Candidatus Frackibacter]SDC82859.1 Glycosyl transferase family 2 [Candidatus Frackibacter sp. WG11]SEM97327.1 Glycosyl transferase family 2 [Candidatus Frackibacter sp. WG12]SFM06034.1 Glycosyl transferase family 2 [Candidatus Frackibacter sp. WG13]